MDTKGVVITRDLEIYTLSSLPRRPAFINLWRPQPPVGPKGTFKWTAAKTLEIHPKACTGMRLSNEGVICVQSSDGYSLQVNTDLNNVKTGDRIHKMPISAIGFTEDGYVTGSTDYSYNFVKFDSGFNMGKFLTKLCMQLALFLLFSLWIIDYLVRDPE